MALNMMRVNDVVAVGLVVAIVVVAGVLVVIVEVLKRIQWLILNNLHDKSILLGYMSYSLNSLKGGYIGGLL